MPRGVFDVIALCALASTACGEDEIGLASSPEVICDGICGAASRCDARIEHAACHSSCASDRFWSDVSGEAAAFLGPCLSGLSCNAVLGGGEAWRTEYDACWQAAKPHLEPTEQVRATCARYAARWFECGWWYAIERCEADFAMWAPSILEQAAACADQPSCSDFRACTEAVFGS